MKFMVLVKATAESEAGQMPDASLMRAMTAYNEELMKAGVLLAGEGLQPTKRGARVRFEGDRRSVIDGPFAETRELVAGYWIFEAGSLQECIDWVKRCPNPHNEDSEIEIRQIFAPEDFADIAPDVFAREEAMRVELEARQKKG